MANDTLNDAAPSAENAHSDLPGDLINKKLAHLRALLGSIYGNGFESFQSCSDRIQDNLLWLASDLAEEIGELRETEANHD